MHVIPDLKALEQKYPNELRSHRRPLGEVHQRDGDSNNIRQAILRYEIEHPVVNDYEFRVWGSYGLRAWPTLALIDPSGYLIGGVSGEGNVESWSTSSVKLSSRRPRQGYPRRNATALAPRERRKPSGPLAFPGKVLADEASGRLWHRRFQPSSGSSISDLDGTVL